MNNNSYFILYGLKDNDKFFVSNTNPIIWNDNLEDAKKFLDRYSAEYAILRDYDNYRNISKQLSNKFLDHIYIAEIENNIEIWSNILL